MRVLINAISHAGGGGITYLKNMLPRFEDDVDEYVVLIPESRRALNPEDYPDVEFKDLGSVADILPLRLLYEQLVLPVRMEQWDIDVLFSPADLTPLLTGKPTLLAIRNPNPYFSANEFGLERPITRRAKFLFQRYLTSISAKKADEVFFVSDFSKETSNEFLDIPEEKIHTIHHGLDPELFHNPTFPDDEQLTRKVDAAEPYFLTVSTVVEHKNYELLFQAYSRLPQGLRDRFPLVIAGRTPSQRYRNHLEDIISENGIEDDAIFLGGVEYENIPYLYSKAKLFILPSKLETFGHTLVEAMTSGVPVVAADSTCIPEITGGAAELFDPNDSEELKEIIVKLLKDQERRKNLSSKGKERAEQFSWDKTFKQTKRLLEKVYLDSG